MPAPPEDSAPVADNGGDVDDDGLGAGGVAGFGLVMVVQPIVDLATGALVAAEALATSRDPAGASISAVFAAAHASGRGFELEAACIRAARRLPARIQHPVPLAINVSPDALEDHRVQAALAGDLSGFVIELTEHPASDPARLDRRVAELRARGAHIALDDVTTGYAGLIRIAELRPDVVKLDGRLVNGIRSSPTQVTVVEALVLLARRLDAQIIAEGVESLADLETLTTLGIDLVQGWAIGRPAPEIAPVADDVVRACRAARRALLSLDPVIVMPQESESTRLTRTFSTTAAIAGQTLAAAGGAMDQRAALDLCVAGAGFSAIVCYRLGPGGGLEPVGVSGDFGGRLRERLDDASAAAARAGVIRELAATDPDLPPAERDLFAARGMSSLLVAPLCFEGDLVGVMEVLQREPRRWTARVILIVKGLAENFAVALASLRG